MSSNVGKVKWFNNAKGYGFILLEDETDLFVHFSNVVAEGFKTLNEGDVVTYEVSEENGKKQAVNVVVTEKAKQKNTRRATYTREKQ